VLVEKGKRAPAAARKTASTQKRAITSFDVARRANVSRATVSFVLNNVTGAKISEKTKARVKEAAHLLGYVPDAAAKALARRKTGNVALVYTRSYHHIASHTFLLRLIDGLMQVVHERNLNLIIDSIDERSGGDNLLRLARAKHIDGLILLEPRNDDAQLLALARDRFPMVLVGTLPGIDLCSIDIDNMEASRQAVEHLIAQGHTRIGCITNAPLTFTAATARLAGYRRALRDHGIRYEPCLVRIGAFNPESGYAAMRAMLEARRTPTAVFVASDTVALGSLRAIHERGLAIPDDIAVFGFDNIVGSSYTMPPLSTVSFPVEEHGKRSGEILIAVIGDRLACPYHETTPFEILVRQSSARRPSRASETKNSSSSNWKGTLRKEVAP
jgi:DNA-binding LacI/PurR family transcriptional regulator